MNPTVQLRNIGIACFLMAVASSCLNQEDRLSRIDANYPLAAKQPDSLVRSQAISGIIRNIASYPSVDAEFIGVGSVKSKQYQRLEWLSKYPTDGELIALAQDANTHVRAYAFWALVNRKSPAVRTVLEEHLSDSSSFAYLSGCMGSTKYMNLFYLDKASSLLSSEDKQGYMQKIRTFYGEEQWERMKKWEKFL